MLGWVSRLRMISARTLRVCRQGKAATHFPDHALARLSPRAGMRAGVLAARLASEGWMSFSRSDEREGAGKTGCWLHPRPCVQG